jgi:UPF0176 protein
VIAVNADVATTTSQPAAAPSVNSRVSAKFGPDEILNISCYKFAALDHLPARKARLLKLCQTLRLKGTILLSPEGINFFVAGLRHAVDALISELRAEPALADIMPKESFSDHQPFSKMLIKIKKEIIAFGVEGIAPHEYTSRKIKPVDLKQWLDEGKPVTLLDTRNDYEYDLGTFTNAKTLPIRHFRTFPEAVRNLPGEMKDQPIVMFCTGGIRCEKAGPFMEKEGFKNVYQLDGGILKYFEEVGGDHYDGECFVFDKRVAVDPKLQETTTTQCYACLMPLTEEEQASSLYSPGESCPHCYEKKHPKIAPEELLKKHQQQLRDRVRPLPGSQPYVNHRPVNVSQTYDGLNVLDFVSARHPQITRDEWQSIIQQGNLLLRGASATLDQTVRAGDRLIRIMPELAEPDVNPDIELIYEDPHVLVVNKPAPLPVHSCGRFHKNTLVHLLKLVYVADTLRPAHRLDANTSGVMILTRDRVAAAFVQTQFERGEVEKTYLARVQGTPTSDEFTVDAAISAEPSPGGLRVVDENGLPSRTDFTVVKRFDDGTTLIECRPLTGRTNQIRVHLWHLGLPIVGDPSYLPGGQMAETQTLDVNSPPMCLHAWKLKLQMTAGEDAKTWETSLPGWA